MPYGVPVRSPKPSVPSCTSTLATACSSPRHRSRSCLPIMHQRRHSCRRGHHHRRHEGTRRPCPRRGVGSHGGPVGRWRTRMHRPNPSGTGTLPVVAGSGTALQTVTRKVCHREWCDAGNASVGLTGATRCRGALAVSAPHLVSAVGCAHSSLKVFWYFVTCRIVITGHLLFS